jgi:hypothetical protein
MRSKNKPGQTAAEREHVARLAELPCAVCDAAGPVEIHELKQGQWFTSIPLCFECHRGPHMGWHGRKAAWAIRKMDEIDALAETIRRLMK